MIYKRITITGPQDLPKESKRYVVFYKEFGDDPDSVFYDVHLKSWDAKRFIPIAYLAPIESTPLSDDDAETFIRNRAFPSGISDGDWLVHKLGHSGTNWLGFAIRAMKDYTQHRTSALVAELEQVKEYLAEIDKHSQIFSLVKRIFEMIDKSVTNKEPMVMNLVGKLDVEGHDDKNHIATLWVGTGDQTPLQRIGELRKERDSYKQQAEELANNFPENTPLYKDSGLWQVRTDDMEDVLFQQGVNEPFNEFINRALAQYRKESDNG